MSAAAESWPWGVRAVRHRRELAGWLSGRDSVFARPMISGYPAVLEEGFFRVARKPGRIPADFPAGIGGVLYGFFNGHDFVPCMREMNAYPLRERRLAPTPDAVISFAAALEHCEWPCDGLFLEDRGECLRYFSRRGTAGKVCSTSFRMSGDGELEGEILLVRKGHEARIACRDRDFWNAFIPSRNDVLLLDENDAILLCVAKSGEFGNPWPGICPWCGFALSDGRCANFLCNERRTRELERFCLGMGEDGIPKKDFRALAALSGEQGHFSLFFMKRAELAARGFSGNCLDAIGRIKRRLAGMPLSKVLGALVIDGMRGRHDVLAPQIKSLSWLCGLKKRDLGRLIGVSDPGALHAWLNDRKPFLCALSGLCKSRRNPAKPKISFSGSFPWPAKKYKAMARKAGFAIAGRPDSHDVLVTFRGTENSISLETFLRIAEDIDGK